VADSRRDVEVQHVEYETKSGAASDVVILVGGKPIEHKVSRFEYRIDEVSGRGRALVALDLPSVKFDVQAEVRKICDHCGHDFEFETRAEWLVEMRRRGIAVPGEESTI